MLLEEKGSSLRKKCFQKSEQALEVSLMLKFDHRVKTDEWCFLTSDAVSSSGLSGLKRVCMTRMCQHPQSSL